MIFLVRPKKPRVLEMEEASMLASFKKNGNDSWNRVEIRRTLLKMSNNKCAYCESLLDISASMEVDHFIAKTLDPDKAVEWDNLLPSCRACNGKKLAHDVRAEPIIDPTKNDPRQHLQVIGWGRLRGSDDLGKFTINKLNLDTRLREVRIEIVSEIMDKIEDLEDVLIEYISGGFADNRKANKSYRLAKGILSSAGPKKEYSGVIASVILNEKLWSEVKDLLVNSKIWDKELKRMEDEAITVALPKF